MKKISTVLITLIIFSSHTNAQDLSSFSPVPYSLTPFLENGLWGYKNESGAIVIKPKFELAAPFYLREFSYTPQKEYLSTYASIKKLTVAKYENKWVLINENGKIKEKLDADEVSLKYNRNSWIYRKNDKYGVISYNGEILSKPIYDFIIPTNKTDSKYGLNQHENIDDFIYQQNGKVGVSRILTIKDEIFEIIPANYYKFYDYYMKPIDFNFKGNSCVLWGDVSGDISLDKTFRLKSDEYIYRHGYEDPIKVDSISPPIKCIRAQKKNYGDNRIYKPMQQSNTWFTSSEVIELRKFKKDGKWGARVFEYIYPSISYDRFLYDSILDFGEYCFATAFKNGESGVINEWGETLLEFKYSKIISLGQNYFALQKDNLWGISYLDTIIFQPIYNDYKLIGNNWHLKKEDNWGVFSHDGKMLCDFKYNKVSRFDTFVNKKLFDKNIIFAKVQLQNKLGIVDENFDEILAPIYDEIGLINIDSSSKDLFVFVKKDGKYGSVNLDKYKKDDIYNLSANYISIKEIENQINLIKKRIESARRLAEQNRIADARRLAEENRIAEARRIAEEKKEAKLAELNRFQNIRKSNIWGVAIGDYYKGGRVIEIYEDGSGILIITGYFSTILKEAKEICKSAFERKMYIADLDEIHDAFRLGIFTEGSKDYAWVVENNTGRYGKYMTIGEKDIISFPGEYSTSRVAYLVERGTIQDMFSGWNEDAKYRCACVKSIGKND